MRFLLLLILPFQLQAADLKDAYDAFEEKDYGKSEEVFSESLKEDPSNHETFYNLGVSQIAQGKVDEAKESFSRAAESDDLELKGRSHYNLGHAEILGKDLEGAQEQFKKALSYGFEREKIEQNLQWVKKQIALQKEQQKQQKQDGQDGEKGEKGEEQDGLKKDPEGDKQLSEKDEDGDQKSGDKDGDGDQESYKKDEDGDKSLEDEEGKQQSAQNQQDGENKEEGQKQSKGSEDENVAEKDPDGESFKKGDEGGEEKMQNRKILSQGELEKQDAEKLIRSVEDKMSRYLFRQQDLEKGGQSANGNDW